MKYLASKAGRGIKRNLFVAAYAVGRVMRNNWYFLLFLTVFLSTLLLAIWLPNLSFVANIVLSSTLTLGQKVSILLSSLGAIETNFTPLSRLLTIIISVLFGLNVSMTAFYFKQRTKIQKAAGINIGGMLSGMLGIGCAACGSVILSSIFGLGATASFIGVLPLKGQEFGVLSVIILSISLFLTTKKVSAPLACPPKNK